MKCGQSLNSNMEDWWTLYSWVVRCIYTVAMHNGNSKFEKTKINLLITQATLRGWGNSWQGNIFTSILAYLGRIQDLTKGGLDKHQAKAIAPRGVRVSEMRFPAFSGAIFLKWFNCSIVTLVHFFFNQAFVIRFYVQFRGFDRTIPRSAVTYIRKKIVNCISKWILSNTLSLNILSLSAVTCSPAHWQWFFSCQQRIVKPDKQ